ncbi:MAG: YchJ family protein, partial [Psychrobium sp.]
MILAPCPCGSADSYKDCCQPFHLSNALPQTPEQLMRSRYCAFVKNDCHYIYATHSPSTRQQVSIASIEQWNNQCQWLGLNIKVTPQVNIVEFVAWFKQDGQLQNHHEVSRFEKQLMDDELVKRFDKQESS